MIDVHTHIIPNIDDGSESVEETFKMLKEAELAGFDKIISTSHYMEHYYESENKERKVWIDVLNQKTIDQNVDIEIYLGNEIYITSNIIKLLEQDKAATLGNTNYVLFEMPLNAVPLNLNDVLFELLQYKLVPVLAHPERYAYIKEDPEMIYNLMEKGVLMQCNFGSFIGQYGRKAQIISKAMLQNGMVHFLGSDAHSKESIYPKIPEIRKYLVKLVGEDKVKEITETNPELLLYNKRIDISEPKHFKFSFRDRMILKSKK